MKILVYLLAFFSFTVINCFQNKRVTVKVEPPSEKPNIVIIFTDDQGYQDVGCFGAVGFSTPNLDKMAEEGVRLTNFYSAQPVCSASRTALLTGCYPNRLGIHGALNPAAKTGINPNETTLAELLKSKGYATAIFGKWHLGSRPEFMPLRHGFDEYFGIPYSNDMWPCHPDLNSRKNWPPLPLYEGDSIITTLDEQSGLTTQITEHAVRFINKNKAKPFFLYVPHPQPHVPLFVSEKYKGKTKQGLYGDVIEEIDWSVGEILKTLKTNGLDEKTLVIFTSDNGPWMSYGGHSGSALPLREGKGTVWEGGVREPFIARWPGVLPAGAVVHEPVMTIDLFPAIAKIVGATLPELPIDGKDVFSILKNEPEAHSPHEAYYFYYHTNELHAVRGGKWKLYFPHTYRTLAGQQGRDDGMYIDYEYVTLKANELYDLEADISETKNVAALHPDVVKRLEKLAEKARQDMGDSLTKRTGSGNREPGRVN